MSNISLLGATGVSERWYRVSHALVSPLKYQYIFLFPMAAVGVLECKSIFGILVMVVASKRQSMVFMGHIILVFYLGGLLLGKTSF